MSGTVITGVGAIVASASRYAEFREVFFADKAVPSPGAEVRVENFEPELVLGRRGLVYLDMCSQMALCAAEEALADALVAGDCEIVPDRRRIATVTSCNLGVLETVHRAAQTIRRLGSMELCPIDLPNASPNVASSHVAIRNRLKGPNVTVANGFSSGLDALLQADLLLRTDRADLVLVLGVESLSDEMAQMLRVASAEFGAGRPTLGEGVAALILEREQQAVKRGVPVRARLLGSGQRQGDGESGSWAVAAALKASLRSASLHSDQIDLILSAECGVKSLQGVEATGFEAVFGYGGSTRRAALKSRIGETYGAAGVFQAVAGIACLESQKIFASPTAWRDPTYFDKVAPLVVKRITARLDRILGIAWNPGELCTAVILGRA